MTQNREMTAKLDSPPCTRRFHWVSSVTGSEETLSALSRRMNWFYGQQEGRALYQKMLSEQEEITPPESSVGHLMPRYVCDLKPEAILEIGCGDGRLYRQLRSYGYAGAYSGVEVAEYLIQQDEGRHPEATWKCANAYQIPFQDSAFDVCFSLYVLEHLVYPERALREMMRVLKPGGCLALVFPDFVEAGIFASQKLGLSYGGSASEKLRNGKVFDALISLFDSRVRLRKALKNAVTRFGPFPVNTRPICLSDPSIMGADVDAIYIASKKEVQGWAEKGGYQIEYPCGTQGEFAEQAFLVISKS